MIALIEMKYTGATPGIVKKKLNEALRRAWLQVGIRWHRWMLPKHFTRAGAREYGYAPRSGESGNATAKGFRLSYTGKKLKAKGHTLPLVWTGISRVLADRRDITATSKGVKIKLPGQFARRGRYSKIDMVREITAVSPGDVRVITETMNDLVAKELRSITTVERKTL